MGKNTEGKTLALTNDDKTFKMAGKSQTHTKIYQEISAS